MDLRDLVHALIARDALTARQWVADARRAGFEWEKVAQPSELDATELAVAAGVVELLAERARQSPAPWTSSVGSSPAPIFLVRAASTMPRLRRLCETEGPLPLRRRQIFAPPDILTFV